MKHDSSKVAKALIRRLAIENLQALVNLSTTNKPTPEERLAARRARQNAELIRTLDKR